MGRAADYAFRNTVLGTDQAYTFTPTADYRTTWDNLVADLGLVQLVGGLIPLSVLPPGLVGGGSGDGDVTGPTGATTNHVVLFDGPTGKLIKQGSTNQLVPTPTTNGYVLGITAGVPTWQPSAPLTIPNNSVTLGQIVNIGAGTFMARKAADGTGSPETLTAAEMRFELGVGSGSGDVVGPSSVTADRVALFNGTTGKIIKQGTSTQLVPTPTTNGFVLALVAGIPTWQSNPALTNPDNSITLAKLVNIPGGTFLARRTADGTGATTAITAAEARIELQVEAGAAADQTGTEMITAISGAVAATADASTFALAVLNAIAAYKIANPSGAHTALTAAGILWSDGLIDTGQVVVGALDNSTGTQAADMINGTPSVAGIVAGSTDMIVTASVMADVWSPRQATLVSGALTFNAAQGLNWTVAAAANNIAVAESCWNNLPLDKTAVLEIVAGATARQITFTDTSNNLAIDMTNSPWNVTSAGTRVRFELGWASEGTAPTVKSQRTAVFIDYLA